MERLTKNVDGCNQIIDCGNDLCKETCEEWSCEFCPISKAIDKLADYEDAEEQGLLLRLPCKVGTILYYPHCAWIDHKIQWLVNDLTVENVDHALSFNGYIGKTVFLTREEAEQALKRMESE